MLLSSLGKRTFSTLQRSTIIQHAVIIIPCSRKFSGTTNDSNSLPSSSSNESISTNNAPSDLSSSQYATSQSWSKEWKSLGLGARLPQSPDTRLTNLFFVQMGFGVDQHGDRSSGGATKAAVRAVRNAIEFNAIPGVIEAIPGGRAEMLISVKLGVPPKGDDNENEGQSAEEGRLLEPMEVDLSEVAKVFPYGRLLPIQVVVGGLKFPTGRIVNELGDVDDLAVCVAASVSIGYDDRSRTNAEEEGSESTHKTYSTKDGF
uniref:Uncharacterized protein n=1 Tax=Helicotheca tamesis TaxID=374047 RepID=A0A7S2H706_9STRA|mmetsp:Transcript_15759/g.21626  ORF Transcript_15759/g.21626 Transcript_15759/m.21626 type:complete len:260 (+) Transcript_15759:57-836(+)